MRDVLKDVLTDAGYGVSSAATLDEAYQLLNSHTFDVMVTDLRFDDTNASGMDLLGWMRENAATTPSIMITGHASVENAIEAMKLGAFDYVMKPFANDEICMAIRRAIEQRNLLRENAALRKDQMARDKAKTTPFKPLKPPKGPSRVLVMDDEASMRELLEIILGNAGYAVTSVPNLQEAYHALSHEAVDVVVTDLRMGNERAAGMNLLAWLRQQPATTPAIMITAHGSIETAIEAMKLGAFDYIMKPFKNDEMRLLVKRAVEHGVLLRENAALRKDQESLGQIDNIIGKSAAIQNVLDMVRRVASLPSTVAIHGESGTGKELVARAIHQLSDRAEKPFVAVNCGGIPENLLESELFGHKKGSFTGAIEDKEGLFVVADGGTLFLDEIGEMPPSLQVKLLRILDNSRVMPVGGVAETPVDVRIISATNRDLDQLVQQGKFRADLYYRLNVIPIHMPPLREHAEDIPLLARYFISSHTARMGRSPLGISPEAVEALSAFRWSGNVRELENVLERAVALCAGDRIGLADLPRNVQNFLAVPSTFPTDLPTEGVDLEALVAELEINLIKQALQRGKYSHKRAAELLGLTPRSLRYRLQKYGLGAE
jgi:two-component system response regulator PilR (NtrC family)